MTKIIALALVLSIITLVTPFSTLAEIKQDDQTMANSKPVILRQVVEQDGYRFHPERSAPSYRFWASSLYPPRSIPWTPPHPALRLLLHIIKSGSGPKAEEGEMPCCISAKTNLFPTEKAYLLGALSESDRQGLFSPGSYVATTSAFKQQACNKQGVLHNFLTYFHSEQ